ncbi:MAG: hypothetical protein ACYTGN_05545 [Planctomycetota bacterium]|jgi:hypothetical protein
MQSRDELGPPALPDRTPRSRLRELASPKRAALVALVVVAATLATLHFTPRADMDEVSPLRLFAGVMVLGVLCLAVALVILQPLHRRPLSARVVGTLAIAALLAPTVFALLPEAHHERLLHPESFADEGTQFWARAAACLVFGSLLALPFIAAVVLLDRRDGLDRGRALQLAFAGGALGNLGLLLHCPLVSHDHIFAGHASVPVFLALLLCTFVWRRLRRT